MTGISDAVGYAIQKDLLDAERQARAITERDLKVYRKLLLEIAEAMAPDVVEAALQRNDDPARWDAHTWRNAKSALLKNPMRHYGLMANDRVRHQQKRINALEHKVKRLAQEAQRLRKAQQEALQDNARLQRELATAHQQATPKPASASAPSSDAPHAAPAPDPAPVQPQDAAETGSFTPTTSNSYPPKPYIPAQAPAGMKPQTYQRDILLLYLLGKTGRARRPWLLEGVAHYIPTVKNGRAGSMSRVLGRLLKAGLIQQLTPSKTPAQMLRLTKDGEDLYRRIYRESPTESEATRLLDGHQPHGLEHAGFTLAAAHYLEKRGLVVRTAPPPINLPGGRRLEADLQAIDPETGEFIYLEAERGIGPAETRTAKWQNHLAFQGAVYIITLEKEQTATLVAEVMALNRVGEVCATDLTYLQDMEHNSGLWRIKRESELAED